MAIDAKSRQQKRARKEKKRKENFAMKQRQHQQLLKNQRMYRVLTCFDDLTGTEIIESTVSSNLFETGIGVARISRRLSGQYIAFTEFLLDVYCLGVKDCYGYIGHPAAYKKYHFSRKSDDQIDKSPEYICKLVFGAQIYAKQIGFSPAVEYTNTSHIFSGIDPLQCADCFEFGNNGKPFYVAGPHENLSCINEILQTLTQHVGENGFDYVVPVFFTEE